MRLKSSFNSGLAASITALLVAAAASFIPSAGLAGDPNAGLAGDTPSPVKAPKLAGLTPPLDVNDEIAALESMQLALTQVADGSTYVWHRSHGRLSGLVRPTASFKDKQGQVCRHLVVVLNGVDFTKKTETIACRGADGAWQLDG